MNKHEVILCIVNTGFSEVVMAAAKDAGARGGTILNARGTANKEAESFFKIAIQPEKEIVMILVDAKIKDAVLQHFKDLGIDPSNKDVTYENCQARERTQILMDAANQTGGLVIGPGELSELVLGWCTYNGDHMSMYAVNTSIPKTLVKYLVRYAAMKGDEEARPYLLDIIDTPISPELTPTNSAGEIEQKTEDFIGPYELNDFFLYHSFRFGASPKKSFLLVIIPR